MQRASQVNALHANSVYLESKEGVAALNEKIRDINSHFDSTIQTIMDPRKTERDMEKIRQDPLMSAGLRGFDRLKWQLQEGLDVYGKADGDG